MTKQLRLSFLSDENAEFVVSPSELHRLEQILKPANLISLDIEGDTTELYGVGLAVKNNNRILSFYIPTAYSNKNVPISKLKLFLESVLKGKQVLGHNIKYDYEVLKSYGIDIGFDFHDTSILAWVLNPTLPLRSRSLDKLAEFYVGKGKTKKFTEVKIWSIADISKYCRNDCEITLLLFEKLIEEVSKQKNLYNIYTLERRIIRYVADMEMQGVALSVKRLKEVEEVLNKEISRLYEEISAISGKRINPLSNQQVSRIIPKEIAEKLPTGKSGFPSTSKKHLEMFSEDPLISRILEYRHLSTLYNTFVKKFLNIARPGDEFVILKGTFQQDGTESGRFKSYEPNLQNIPRRGSLGNLIRSVFVPRSGMVFVISDASQLELRILAAATKDKRLVEIFQNDLSLHEEVSKMLSVDYDIAKTVNFSIIYGVSASSLAKRLKISEKEAEKIIHKFYKNFPSVKTYKHNLEKSVAATKTIKSLFGRERKFKDEDFATPQKFSATMREAFNYSIQATGADIIKIWMYMLSKNGVKAPLLQVHDELVFEIEEKDAKEFIDTITDLYENNKYIKMLAVPFKLESVVGKSWAEK